MFRPRKYVGRVCLGLPAGAKTVLRIVAERQRSVVTPLG